MISTSIAIVSAGDTTEVHRCLSSIVAYKGDHQIIFVDDSHAQDLGPFVRDTFGGDLIVLSNGVNRGASYSRNRAAAGARHEYILFIDSDCVLEKGFLPALQNASDLIRRDDVAGISFKVFGSEGMFSQGIRTDRLLRTYNIRDLADAIQEVECINTCCCLLKKECFQSRGFQESFGYIFEDVEFSWYLRRKGLRFFYYPFSVAYHSGNSFKAASAYKVFLSYRNRLFTILMYHRARLPAFFCRSLWYECARAAKLFFMNPRLLVRAWREAIRYARSQQVCL